LRSPARGAVKTFSQINTFVHKYDIKPVLSKRCPEFAIDKRGESGKMLSEKINTLSRVVEGPAL
jgi:hypothetical protein